MPRPRKVRRRWPLIRLIDGLIKLIPPGRPAQGALIICGGNIGDALFFKAMMPHYLAAFGDVTILGSTMWQAAAEMFFPGQRIIFLNHKKITRDWWYRLCFGIKLRRRSFKIALCDKSHRDATANDALIDISGAEQKFTCAVDYDRTNKYPAEQEFYAGRMTRTIDTAQGNRYRYRPLQQAGFLSQILGKPIAPPLPSLDKKLFPKPAGLPASYIVIHPGASLGDRCWPLENFLALAKKFMREGRHVVFVGGKSELKLSEAIDLEFGQTVYNLIGQTSFATMAAILAHADVAVVNETGPGHMAIALGVKTAMLVGGGHFGYFAPPPPELAPPQARYIFQKMPCYNCGWDCYIREAKDKIFPCINQIPLENAIEALDSLLNTGVASLKALP
ncbi:MAG: glycosyltransferase family 9 protein [Dongiaceae bacterium]